MNRSRRTFLVTGTLGAAALATAEWLRLAPAARVPGRGLDADGSAVVRAITPALLAGALPGEPGARAEALRETVANVDAAIAGLPPEAQSELAQFFTLLRFAPARIVLAGLRADWPDATPADIEAVLQRWRTSRVALLRSAYDGLHQLVLASWYGNPRAWDAIGYPGPPALT